MDISFLRDKDITYYQKVFNKFLAKTRNISKDDLVNSFGGIIELQRNDDISNKLYFLNPNLLKGKYTTDTGRILNAGTVHTKRLECDFCHRIFHKEYGVKDHEKKVHKNSRRKDSRPNDKLNYYKDMTIKTLEEQKESKKKQKDIEDIYTLPTTDEEDNKCDNDSDSDIEIILNEGSVSFAINSQRNDKISRTSKSKTHPYTLTSANKKRKLISDGNDSDSGISVSSPKRSDFSGDRYNDELDALVLDPFLEEFIKNNPSDKSSLIRIMGPTKHGDSKITIKSSAFSNWALINDNADDGYSSIEESIENQILALEGPKDKKDPADLINDTINSTILETEKLIESFKEKPEESEIGISTIDINDELDKITNAIDMDINSYYKLSVR